MYSTVVLLFLFFFALIGIWLLLVNAKIHDKAINKTEKYTKENFGEKGEGVK